MEPKLNDKLIETVCTVINNNELKKFANNIKNNYYIPYKKVTYISEEEYETLRKKFLNNIEFNYTKLINSETSREFLENQLNLLTKNEINNWCNHTSIILNNIIRPFIDYLPNFNEMQRISGDWRIVNHLESIISSILFYGCEFKNDGLLHKVKQFKCPKCNENSKDIFIPEFCHTYRCNNCINQFDRDMHEDYLVYIGRTN